MKRFFRAISMLLVCILILSTGTPITVEAASSDKYYDDYRKMTPQYNVAPNKIWQVNFNRPLARASYSTQYIRVLDEKDKYVPISMKINDDKDSILIKSNKEYTMGKTYKLVISDKLKDSKGELIGNGTVMEFTIGNIYTGLPIEQGLIVLGDKAYSLEYLQKNTYLMNDIMKGDYEILYVYEETEEHIKDLFGQNFIDGSKPPKDYDRDKPITYIDGEGVKHVYSWSDDKGRYELIPPGVDIKVNLNSALQVVTLEVNKLYGVDGKVEGEDGEYFFKTNRNNEIATISTKSNADNKLIFGASDEKVRLYIMDKNKEIIGYTDIVTTYSSERRTMLTTTIEHSKGNSFGNINNNGYATQDNDGYAYYNNTSDGNKLYRMNYSGSENREISPDYAQYINYSDGWIYYSNYSDNGKLYRIKDDGSKREKLTDDISAYVNVVGQWIYYANHSDGGRIYKVLKDGSNAKDAPWGTSGIPVSEELDDEAAFINVEGDWIYYSNLSDRGKPYVINKDATYRAKIGDETASSIQLHDGWVYYTTTDGDLKKVDKDGNKKYVTLDGQASKIDKGYHLNVVEDWIFYSNADDKGRLYKLDANGSGQKVPVCSYSVTYINIVGEEIYFVSDNKLYKIPLDSVKNTKPELVSKGKNDTGIKEIEDIYVEIPHQDINLGIANIEKKYLPTKVPAILSDNTIQQLVVVWDVDDVRIQNGLRVYEGKVVGYNETIKLYMKIPSEMLNSSNTIHIYSNPGTRGGVIEISNAFATEPFLNPAKLLIGDEVSIYDDPLLKNPISTARVYRDGNLNKARFTNLRLDKTGTVEYYITVTRKDKTESEPTVITIGDIPEIVNSVHVPVRDEDDLGVKVDGRDFQITEWRQGSTKDYEKHEVYITTSTNVDFSDYKIKPIDNVLVVNGVEQDWIGKKEHVVDSMGKPLKEGNYQLFIASYYEESATPDKNGSAPKVVGKIMSEAEKIEAEEEEVPNEPNIKTETLKGMGQLKLSYTPKFGEIAFLVPVEVYFPDNGCGVTDSNDPNKHKGEHLCSIILDDFATWLGEHDKGFTDALAGAVIEPDFYDAFQLSDIYEQYRSKIKDNTVTMLVGDGRENIINVPKGLSPVKGTNDYNYMYTDIRYKLIVFNKVGASARSKGTLTVDNRPPTITDDGNSNDVDDLFVDDKDEFVAGKDYINIQSLNENATLYLVRSTDYPSNVGEIEALVRDRKAYKFPLNAGGTQNIMTSGIKAKDKFSGSTAMNYKLYVTDAVGNMTTSHMYLEKENGEIELSQTMQVLVYVDTTELRHMLDDARKEILSGELTEDKRKELEDIVEDAKSLVADIDNPDMTRVVDQTAIDSMVNKLDQKMIECGALHRYMDVVDVSAAMRYKFENLRSYRSKSIEIDEDGVVEDIWMPTTQTIPDKTGNEKIKITWSTGGSEYIKPVGSDKQGVGEVTRPVDGDQFVDIVANIELTIYNHETKQEETLGEPISLVYRVAVKSLELEAKPSSPNDNTFVLTPDGFSIDDLELVFNDQLSVGVGETYNVDADKDGKIDFEVTYNVTNISESRRVVFSVTEGVDEILNGYEESITIEGKELLADGRTILSNRMTLIISKKDGLIDVRVTN